MTQYDLNRAVARITGDSVGTVKRLGFLLADPGERVCDPDDERHGPSVIDWDDLGDGPPAVPLLPSLPIPC